MTRAQNARATRRGGGGQATAVATRRDSRTESTANAARPASKTAPAKTSAPSPRSSNATRPTNAAAPGKRPPQPRPPRPGLPPAFRPGIRPNLSRSTFAFAFRPAITRALARLRRWDTPWSRLALQAAGLWLATRLAYVALTFFAVAFSAPDKTASVAGLLLQHWERLDTNWYVNISRYGYWAPTAATFARDGGQMPTAFFPLYPMLINAMSHLLGDTQRTFSALLVANLGTLLAFIGMAFFAAQEDGLAAGLRTLHLTIAYPLAFFLAAGYTDGLFFGLAVFALFFARRGAWPAAALCAFIAGLTRITALALILPLGWEFARQHGWGHALATLASRPATRISPTHTVGARPVSPVSLRPAAPASVRSPLSAQEERLGVRPPASSLAARLPHLARVLALGLLVVAAVPLGIGLYMRYLALTFHDPLSFAHAAQSGWYHVTLPPWQSLPLGLHLFFSQPPWSYAQAQILLDLGAVFVFALLTLLAAPRLPFAFTLYMAGLLLLAVVSPTIFPTNANIFSSAGRYLIPSAPIFLALSRWTVKHPALESLLVDGGFLLQAALAALWLAIAAYIV